MRVDGVQVADAGGNHANPPAFQIIVLVSAYGVGLHGKWSLLSLLDHALFLYAIWDAAPTFKFDRCLGRLVQSSRRIVCLHCILRHLVQP